MRPDGYGPESGGWSIAELSQLHSDLDSVRQDVEQRLSLLNQEAPKVNQYQQAAAASGSGGGGGGGRGGGRGGQRKKKKSEEDPFAEDGAEAKSPRAAAAAVGVSDRTMGSNRGRGGRGGRGGGRKRKKKQTEGLFGDEESEGEEEEEEEEEEAPPQEDELDTMDSTAFWAMIDQQYCDPSPQDIESLRAVRSSGAH